ncbi:MAG: CHAT domain-containing protein, partial [Blastocatellia bacterium]|nr:CHAT domain-containing protein [Blastocatellia bacterium]
MPQYRQALLIILILCITLLNTYAKNQEASKHLDSIRYSSINIPKENELKVGKAINKVLKAQERISFFIKLKGKEYVKGVVQQKGIDAVVRIYNPDGQQIAEIDSPNGLEGPEPIEIVTEKGGRYVVEISSLEKEAQPGEFEIKIGEKRSAQKGEAEKVFALRESQNLANQFLLFAEQGKYSEAIPLVEKALEIKKKFLGLEDPGVAETTNLLGQFYNDIGDYQQADNYYREALRLFEKNFGSSHQEVVAVLNNLGVLYRNKGEYQKAEEFHTRSIETAKILPGTTDLSLALLTSNLAVLYNDMGERTKAEPLFLSSLEVFEKHFGLMHPRTALTVNNLAVLYRDNGEFSKAEPLYKKALEIYEKTLGIEHPQTNLALNNLGQLYSDIGDYQQAESLLQQALEISKKIFSPSSREIGQRFNSLALLYEQKGEYEKAEILYKESLAILEKSLGQNHPQVSITINNLGKLYNETGNYKQSELFLNRALETSKKTLGEDHPQVARVISNLALLHTSIGDYHQAKILHKKALEIGQKALGFEHVNMASLLSNLASLHMIKNEYVQAEALYKQGLEIVEKVIGSSNAQVAQFLHNLASLYSAKGEYERAEPLFKRSLDMYEKALGASHPELSNTLNNIAGFYRDKGEYEKAEVLQKRSLEIRKKAFGSSSRQVAQSLNNLASAYRVEERYEEAESLYKQSMEIYEKLLGSNHSEVATVLNNLASIYKSRGEYSQAETALQRALEIYEKELGEFDPKVSIALNNLGLIYIDKGEYTRAEPLFKRAVEIAQSKLGNTHPLSANGLRNLSLLYHCKGIFTEAIKYQIETNKGKEEFLARNLTTGSEGQKLTFLNVSEIDFHHTLSLHSKAPKNKQALSASLTVVLQRKGRALDAMAQNIETLRTRAAEGDRELLDELSSKRSELSIATLKGTGKENAEGYIERLKELEKDVEKLEEQIGQRVAEFKLQAQPITLEAVQRVIPEDTVLIEFSSYKYVDIKTKKAEKRRYVVYILESKGDGRWVELGDAERIDNAIYKLRGLLRNKKSNIELEVASASRAVDRLVMRPVRKMLTGNKKRLLICPDGALNVLPFAALIDETGKYLIEKYKLSYLTSGRDLLRLEMKNSSQHAGLIVADPDYEVGTGPFLIGKQFSPLKRLQATLEEGKKIQNIFETAELKVEKEATEENIKRIKSPEILHIATHGYFLENEKRENRVADESTRLLVQEKTEEKREKLINPLLRSWLFFAGANKVEEKGEERESDSIMTALEAASLDLTGTKLVTLSACDTGVGEVRNGEGVYGMRRALVLAGSESQMMSLWPVSDKGTKDLMVDYYRRLKKREGRSDALQNAQLR